MLKMWIFCEWHIYVLDKTYIYPVCSSLLPVNWQVISVTESFPKKKRLLATHKYPDIVQKADNEMHTEYWDG